MPTRTRGRSRARPSSGHRISACGEPPRWCRRGPCNQDVPPSSSTFVVFYTVVQCLGSSMARWGCATAKPRRHQSCLLWKHLFAHLTSLWCVGHRHPQPCTVLVLMRAEESGLRSCFDAGEEDGRSRRFQSLVTQRDKIFHDTSKLEPRGGFPSPWPEKLTLGSVRRHSRQRYPSPARRPQTVISRWTRCKNWAANSRRSCRQRLVVSPASHAAHGNMQLGNLGCSVERSAAV